MCFLSCMLYALLCFPAFVLVGAFLICSLLVCFFQQLLLLMTSRRRKVILTLKGANSRFLLCYKTVRNRKLTTHFLIRGGYHGGRRPSSDDSFHSPSVIPPSALDKPSTMKRYHRRRTCSHTSPRRSSTMVTLYDTRFVESRW